MVIKFGKPPRRVSRAPSHLTKEVSKFGVTIAKGPGKPESRLGKVIRPRGGNPAIFSNDFVRVTRVSCWMLPAGQGSLPFLVWRETVINQVIQAKPKKDRIGLTSRWLGSKPRADVTFEELYQLRHRAICVHHLGKFSTKGAEPRSWHLLNLGGKPTGDYDSRRSTTRHIYASFSSSSTSAALVTPFDIPSSFRFSALALFLVGPAQRRACSTHSKFNIPRLTAAPGKMAPVHASWLYGGRGGNKSGVQDSSAGSWFNVSKGKAALGS